MLIALTPDVVGRRAARNQRRDSDFDRESWIQVLHRAVVWRSRRAGVFRPSGTRATGERRSCMATADAGRSSLPFCSGC